MLLLKVSWAIEKFYSHAAHEPQKVGQHLSSVLFFSEKQQQQLLPGFGSN